MRILYAVSGNWKNRSPYYKIKIMYSGLKEEPIKIRN